MSDPVYIPGTAPKVAAADLPKPPLADVPWLKLPPRPVWVAGLAGLIINWGLAYISGRWHFDLAAWLQPIINGVYGATAPGTAAPGAQAILALGLSVVIASLTDRFWPSFKDVYRRINSNVIAHAVLDPAKTDVSAPQIAAAVNVATVEAALATKPGVP